MIQLDPTLSLTWVEQTPFPQLPRVSYANPLTIVGGPVL